MVKLELLPPYALEDVKQAYMTKAHDSHPDHGGSVTDFLALQDAYQAAKEYIQFRGDRRKWIASMVERSVRQDKAVAALREHGAEVLIKPSGSMERSLGDFAVLLESILAVSLKKSKSGNHVIQRMVEEEDLFTTVESLNLVECDLSDEHVMKLSQFVRVSHLDLSKNPITERSLSIVSALPALTEFKINGTQIGWGQQRRARAVIKRRKRDAEKLEKRTRVFREMFNARHAH